MFWCKICKYLSRNDLTIKKKNMVLVDYIGIFLHFRILLTDDCHLSVLMSFGYYSVNV